MLKNYPSPQQLLPHRAPLLLIDRILDFQQEEYIETSVVLHPEMLFFQGHFPGNPILPGVILVEMMFQTCGLYARMCLNGNPRPNSVTNGRAIKIHEVTFLKEVLPSDRLHILANLKIRFSDFQTYSVRIFRKTEIVASGVVSLYLKEGGL